MTNVRHEDIAIAYPRSGDCDPRRQRAVAACSKLPMRRLPVVHP